jgi:hypothetical protein
VSAFLSPALGSLTISPAEITVMYVLSYVDFEPTKNGSRIVVDVFAFRQMTGGLNSSMLYAMAKLTPQNTSISGIASFLPP